MYDGRTPYKAILWGGAGYRGGHADAEEYVKSADKVAQIKGVQVNLQIHSWAGDDGYPGGGVLERGLMLKSRKPGMHRRNERGFPSLADPGIMGRE